MRVFTDGSAHLVLDARGLRLFEDGRARAIHASALSGPLARGHLSALAGARVIVSATDRRSGALPDGRTIEIPGTARIDWLVGMRRYQEVQPDALAVWGEGHVVASIPAPRRNEGARLAFRSIDALWEERRAPPEWDERARFVVLDAPRDVAWPAPGAPGRLWKDLPPSPSGPTRAWQLAAGAHGTTAIGLDTGVIAMLGATPSERASTLRVPVGAPEMMLDAAATSRGVLVGFGGGRSDGAVQHFARDGAHLGGLAIDGIAAPVAVSGERAFVAVSDARFSSRLAVWVIDLERWEVRERIATELSSTRGAADVAASMDGRVVIVGDGEDALLVTEDAAGRWTCAPLERAPEPVAPTPTALAPSAPARPRRVHHPRFGAGTILSQSGAGETLKYEIRFDDAGAKTLQARFVAVLDG